MRFGHREKIDYWDRDRCVTWCVTMLCRHAASEEPSHPVTLQSDGTIRAGHLVTLPRGRPPSNPEELRMRAKVMSNHWEYQHSLLQDVSPTIWSCAI